MSQAMSAYRNGDMGLNASAKAYGLPKATLRRHLDGSNKHANGEIKKHGIGSKSFLCTWRKSW